MPSRRRSRRPPAPHGLPATIAFRVTPNVAKALVERASELHISPHDFARNLVIEALRPSNQPPDPTEALEGIHEALLQVRSDVATTAEVLLVTAGKLSREAAYRWVEENLVKPPSAATAH